MLLFARGIKPAHRPEPAVVFQAGIDLLSDRIGHFEVGGEFETALLAGAGKRAFERRIERQIPATQGLVEDRANLPAPLVLGKLSPTGQCHLGGTRKRGRMCVPTKSQPPPLRALVKM